MNIRIQCDQIGCKFNSEYTINNEHECRKTGHPVFYNDPQKGIICYSKKVDTITTQDLLEIDKSKACQDCGLINSENCNTCLNLSPQQ